MRTHITCLLLAALLGLSGCGGQTPPPAPTVASSNVAQDTVSRIGDVSIRASVVQTSTLTPAVASRYGIARDDRSVLLLVALRQGPQAQETSLPAQITATVTDLRGRTQSVSMRELRSSDPSTGSGQAPSTGSGQLLLDYIGIVEVSPPDTLRFDLSIVREGGARSTMQFSRDFYPR